MSERYLKENDETLLVAEAPWVGDGGKERVGVLAVHSSSLKSRMNAGMAVSIAQLYGTVLPGIILTKYIFKGLNRPLYCDESFDGDKEKLVYVRRPTVDYIVTKNKATSARELTKLPAPAGKTFVVIVSPNTHKNEFPSVDGWIDHWNWADEDTALAEAPTNWVDRYQERIFTRL